MTGLPAARMRASSSATRPYAFEGEMLRFGDRVAAAEIPERLQRVLGAGERTDQHGGAGNHHRQADAPRTCQPLACAGSGSRACM